jgi:hypothetical protein
MYNDSIGCLSRQKKKLHAHYPSLTINVNGLTPIFGASSAIQVGNDYRHLFAASWHPV